ncbi:MAG: cobalamin-dependent protein [Alphaproteobacteria bacterium]
MVNFEQHRPEKVVTALQSSPKIILGVAASDAHVVANHLIAMYLRDHGFEVINLGACTPLSEFMQMWQRHPDASAIIIGSLNGHAAEDLEDLPEFKQNYQVRCPIIVGGNLSVGALKTGVETARLLENGVDAVISNVDELLPYLRTLSNALPFGSSLEEQHAYS